MIKVIACDNDKNLLNYLKNHTQVELIKTKLNVAHIIENCKKHSPDMLILQFNETILNKEIIIKKIFELYLNKFIIIQVEESRIYFCFDKVHFLLDFIRVLENHQEIATLTLEKNIYDMLWKLRFNIYSKGSIYLKDAIILAYQDKSLLYDTNKLMRELSILYNLDEKNIRNNIDNALNLAFKYENLQYDIEFFNGYYDGRKVSLKYFIALAVYYIDIDINSNEDSSNLLLNL